MVVGIMPGKFLPPHRGHLTSILKAHTQVDKLYVVVSERPDDDASLCSVGNCKYISGSMRKKWLCQETQGLDGIQVILINEGDIPSWPNGWSQWANLVRKAVNEPIDIIFGGEVSYSEGSKINFPEAQYKLIDPDRNRWPISGTEIRNNPYKHWDYIVGSARPFFAKKVLITGTESCGKSTMTKKLAKIYYTSWSEEVGRYYSRDYLGGDESAFTDDDFMRIAHLQYENDFDALNKANKVCFFDTDAVVTDYYAEQYLGHHVESVGKFIDSTRYDMVMFMAPDVKWVPDGLRFLGEDSLRWKLHDKLYKSYIDAGFAEDKIKIIRGDYEERLSQVMSWVDSLIV